MKNHSGGKFGNNSAYKFSRGIHGIGNKCICALSSYAKAITHRDGKAVELIMSRGDLVDLKYYEGKPVIKMLDRVSKPSCRVYSKLKKVGSVFNGFGIYVLSTSKGVMSDAEARENNVGGEILCKVF